MEKLDTNLDMNEIFEKKAQERFDIKSKRVGMLDV